jgi:hypothetical protein
MAEPLHQESPVRQPTVVEIIDKEVTGGNRQLTPMGPQMLAARRRIERMGTRLLTRDQLDREIAERRGGIAVPRILRSFPGGQEIISFLNSLSHFWSPVIPHRNSTGTGIRGLISGRIVTFLCWPDLCRSATQVDPVRDVTL